MTKLTGVQAGHQFPAATYALTPEAVAAYLGAVGNCSALYGGDGPVPPTLLLAWALRSVLEAVELPPGTLHGSQEMEALAAARVGERVTCQGKVANTSPRGGWRFVAIDLSVAGDGGRPLLRGRGTVMFPEGPSS